jgi:hypothetical protein
MTTMSSSWYEIVDAASSLTQGDLIFDCPLLHWDPAAEFLTEAPEPIMLQRAARISQADVVVMTQACDLAHGKVRNVVLCPHLALTAYRSIWESSESGEGRNPTAKSWRKLCNDIADGFVWSQAFLNRGESPQATIDLRVVDFREVYTVPRDILLNLLIRRGKQRWRLLPPYREHLSQAYARFFMRVGLPQPVDRTW